MNELVIGVDGGGTRTRATVADHSGKTLGTGEAGTSNPLVHGVQAAQHELDLAIARAFENAKQPRTIVAALCMGLGGAGRAREQQELVAWARETIAERVEVVNDGQIVLAAGTPENWGVAVIAGTGSLAWGRNRAGETARAGGWGYIMGDEGSAFDLARRALRAATQFADGRGDETKLLDAILEFWKLSEPQDLIGRVYRSGLTHTDIAQLAPIVVACAERGDGVAMRLVADAAEALARGVATVSRALEMSHAPFPLALTGGLVLGAEFFREQLWRALEQHHCEGAPVELVHHPVQGAVRLALTLAHTDDKVT
jgi:N-acetylglucosamine kinase-like BadF-type ATPase